VILRLVQGLEDLALHLDAARPRQPPQARVRVFYLSIVVEYYNPFGVGVQHTSHEALIGEVLVQRSSELLLDVFNLVLV